MISLCTINKIMIDHLTCLLLRLHLMANSIHFRMVTEKVIAFKGSLHFNGSYKFGATTTAIFLVDILLTFSCFVTSRHKSNKYKKYDLCGSLMSTFIISAILAISSCFCAVSIFSVSTFCNMATGNFRTTL